MNPTHTASVPQTAKRGPRALSAPRHARCRDAVLAALKATRPLPSDAEVRDKLTPLVNAHPDVIDARARLETARLHASGLDAQGRQRPPWSQRDAQLAVEHATRELQRSRGFALHDQAQDMVPHGAPAGTRWPWRHEGAPWVWRADLLLALPDWSHTAIHGALERLEAEGLLEGSNATRAKKAAAVRLTARGLQLDELVATLKARPDVLDGPVGDALNDDAEAGAL
jgi:hypothetical protein